MTILVNEQNLEQCRYLIKLMGEGQSPYDIVGEIIVDGDTRGEDVRPEEINIGNRILVLDLYGHKIIEKRVMELLDVSEDDKDEEEVWEGVHTNDNTDIVYAHEEDSDQLLRHVTTDGLEPLFVLYSEDDETYFVSKAALSVERLKTELSKDVQENFDITS